MPVAEPCTPVRAIHGKGERKRNETHVQPISSFSRSKTRGEAFARESPRASTRLANGINRDVVSQRSGYSFRKRLYNNKFFSWNARSLLTQCLFYFLSPFLRRRRAKRFTWNSTLILLLAFGAPTHARNDYLEFLLLADRFEIFSFRHCRAASRPTIPGGYRPKGRNGGSLRSVFTFLYKKYTVLRNYWVILYATRFPVSLSLFKNKDKRKLFWSNCHL